MDAEKVNALLADHQQFHSEFQMNYFITARAGGTTQYGQYKQALRELSVRWENLKNMDFERQLLEVDIQEHSARLKRIKDRFAKKRLEITIKQLTGKLEGVLRTVKDVKREFEHFYNQALVLKKDIGELSPERIREKDVEMWKANIKQICSLDFIMTGRLQRETIAMLMSTPKEFRDSFFKPSTGRELVDWFCSQDVIAWFEAQEPTLFLSPKGVIEHRGN